MFLRFEYYIFYVLYSFVTYLLTPSHVRKIKLVSDRKKEHSFIGKLHCNPIPIKRDFWCDIKTFFSHHCRYMYSYVVTMTYLCIVIYVRKK
jgi:hypothetical protein